MSTRTSSHATSRPAARNAAANAEDRPGPAGCATMKKSPADVDVAATERGRGRSAVHGEPREGEEVVIVKPIESAHATHRRPIDVANDDANGRVSAFWNPPRERDRARERSDAGTSRFAPSRFKSGSRRSVSIMGRRIKAKAPAAAPHTASCAYPRNAVGGARARAVKPKTSSANSRYVGTRSTPARATPSRSPSSRDRTLT